MVPIGHSAPLFPKAPRQRGRYAAGGRGMVEFGSPVPEVVEAWAGAIRHREMLDWGGVAMRIADVEVVSPPDYVNGRARLRTATPVVMKRGGVAPTVESAQRGAAVSELVSPEADSGSRADAGKGVWLLPTDPEFPSYVQGNLNRKLETLGLPGTVTLNAITWVGAKRSFAVGGGAKPGAPIGVELSGDPEALQAIWSWGLGQANSAGFGWVEA
ncbi:CRISPR-associated endoribonuclease Cas6 [Micromonospora rosaria]